jgi:NAD(P)-dependent dehydrogenase (short-subunit alcohol dehydrogenase family)
VDALAGKVAVITGAGSGIGRALALHCASLGMKLALLDMQRPGLEEVRAEIALPREDVLLRHCDVADPLSVEATASAVYEELGGADLLFNNAGVFTGGPVWKASPEEWQWQFGVNVMGIANGLRSFVPRMLEQGRGGHIINTSSMGGHVALRGIGVYCATKHAVVAISEALYHDLRAAGSDIGVSVLCPAFVKTGIAETRHRPAALGDLPAEADALLAETRHAMEAARLSPADVARITLEGVQRGDFYIFPHQKAKVGIEQRVRDVLAGRAPVDVFKAPSHAAS